MNIIKANQTGPISTNSQAALALNEDLSHSLDFSYNAQNLKAVMSPKERIPEHAKMFQQESKRSLMSILNSSRQTKNDKPKITHTFKVQFKS